MRTCLVVLNYNDSKRCLQVIEYGKKHQLFDEYVLVDNGSQENEKKFVKKNVQENIHLIENSINLGYGAGHNVGLKYAVDKLKCDYIFVVVSDIKYTSILIDECIKVLEANLDIGAVSCRMKKPNGEEEISAWRSPTYISFLCWCYPLLRRIGGIKGYTYNDDDDRIKIVDVIRGSFLCFRAKALKEADYFDENIFMYNEENALACRLRDEGYKLAQLTDVYYIHDHIEHGMKKRSTWKRICKEAESGVYFMHKYNKINGMKLYLLKISTYFLCCYRYLGRILKNKFK